VVAAINGVSTGSAYAGLLSDYSIIEEN